MDEILFEYMTDAEKRLASSGEVTNPAFSDGMGYTDDGIMSPRIFGEKGVASCQCGKVHDDGAWCAECGTQAQEDPLGRMGHIELAVGWPEGFEALLCEILDIEEDKDPKGRLLGNAEEKFHDLCTGESSMLINGKDVSGLFELEKACENIDLQTVINRLEERIDFLDGALVSGDSKVFKKIGKGALGIERWIEETEDFLDCLRAMQEMNLTPADLFSHVIMVSPTSDRPVSELGIDPLGKKNNAYVAILNANNELKAELNYNERKSESEKKRYAEVLKNFVDTMQASCKDLAEELTGDKTRGKKGFGEELQKARVSNSTFAVAEVSKNLPIDTVAIPYNMLLFMYKDEVYKKLLENAEAWVAKATAEREILENDIKGTDESFLADMQLSLKNAQENESQAKIHLDDVKNNALAEMEMQRFQGHTQAYEDALLDVINAPSRQGDGIEVPSKVVMVGRFPVVSKNSIVALKPVLSQNGHCISVNPAVCERLGLDFDGDQLQVYRIKSPEAQEELWKNASPLHQPFSATSGEVLHANDREDALGVWIATRMDMPEDCNFQRDAVLTNFIGKVTDGVLETEGWVYARHILWSSEEGFQRTAPEAVVNPGDEIGRTKDGKIITAPWFGMLQETKDGYNLLSIPQDRVHLPRGAKLNFNLTNTEKDCTLLDNIPMPKGSTLANWKVQEVESGEVDDLYKKGVLDANSAIYLTDAELTTTAGRLMVAQMMTSSDEGIPEEYLTNRIGKTQIKKALGVLYENVFSREDLSLEEKAQIVMQKQQQLQELGSQFAQFYASYSDLDALKYEYKKDARGQVLTNAFEDTCFRFNSIKEQVESGAKGTQKNVDNFIKFIMGQDKILDAKNMAESVYKLDKAGRADPMDGITPVQRTGSIQRILSEAMYNVEIEQEDCGTTKFESVGIGEGSTVNIFNKIKGRYLANDYVAGDGAVYKKDTLLNTTQAKEIAYDIVAHYKERIKKTVDIRTVSGCLCNGSCVKCWGRSSVIPEAPKIGAKIGLEAVMALTSGITEQGNLKALANSGTENAESAKVFQNILNGLDVYGSNTIRGQIRNPQQAQQEVLRNLKTLVKEAQLTVPDNYLELLARSQISITYRTAKGRHKMGYGEFLRKAEVLRPMLQNKTAWGFTLHAVPYMNAAKQTDRARFALAGKKAIRNIMEAGIRNKARLRRIDE